MLNLYFPILAVNQRPCLQCGMKVGIRTNSGLFLTLLKIYNCLAKNLFFYFQLSDDYNFRFTFSPVLKAVT